MEELRNICRGEATIPSVTPVSDTMIQIGSSIHYIVAGVVVRQDKVLMVQEAKPSCRGRWYLPAGRMKKGETIHEAVIREVKEESGLEFQPLAVVAVERSGRHWVRFTFTGNIVGGKLKTPQEEDSESIQAQWVSCNTTLLKQQVLLRAMDCIPLIELAAKWFGERPAKVAVGIVPCSHQSMSLRIVLVHKMDDKLFVLAKQRPMGNSRLPCSGFSDVRWYSEVENILAETGYESSFQCLGILNIEHSSASLGTSSITDGARFTLLCQAKGQTLKKASLFYWLRIDDHSVVQTLTTALTQQFYCSQLMDI